MDVFEGKKKDIWNSYRFRSFNFLSHTYWPTVDYGPVFRLRATYVRIYATLLATAVVKFSKRHLTNSLHSFLSPCSGLACGTRSLVSRYDLPIPSNGHLSPSSMYSLLYFIEFKGEEAYTWLLLKVDVISFR